MPDRSQAPVIHHAVEFDLQLPPSTVFTLDNGLKVHAVDAGEEDVMLLELLLAAGNSHEPRNMVAGATNFLIKNGTSTRSAFDMNEQIDFYGAHLSRACQHETASITLHTLSKHLAHLLPVITDMLTDATFPQEELDIFIQNSKQRLSVNLLKCDFVAGREIDVLLFGKDHPYGKFSSMEDLDALDRQVIVDFYEKHYIKGEAVLFAAGKLPADLAEQLNAAFGHLPLRPFAPTAKPPDLGYDMPGENRIHRLENDPKGVQGAIRLARHFPNRHHPDFHKIQVLNNVFGGFFGSRLMNNIREDKGYTYGIHSYLQNHAERSAWLVSTEAGRDVCEATIKEIYHEMKRLRDGFIDEEELLLVRNHIIGSILGSLDGPFHIISRWKSYFLYGIDDGEAWFNHSIETIKTVSAEELQSLAKKYLHPEAFYELVVV